MRVLLLGANGMLARDIRKATPTNRHVTALTREQLDIRSVAAVDRAIGEHRPEWVFNCTAFTNVDASERQPDDAFAVNAVAVAQLADRCRKHEVALLHVSTDYVFDGTIDGFYAEDDKPRPINVYGESKLAGEVGVQESGARHLIVRTQWLFGSGGRSFVGLMCERAAARQPTRVVSDEIGCFTYTVDLARAVWQLVGRAEGIVHVANRGKVSRFTIATRIFDHFGASALLTACTSEDFGSAARRPMNSALSVRRAERILGYELATWDDALRRFLIERERAAGTS